MERVQTLFQTEMTALWKAVQHADFSGSPLQGTRLPELLNKLDIKKFLELHKQMLHNMLTFDKAPIKGLMHCDLRCEHIFFSEAGLKLVDWKYALIGLPMSDVLRFLVQNLKPADLKQHYPELLKLYTTEFEQASKLKVTEEYVHMSVLNYIMVEAHFLASTLGFLKDVPVGDFKDLFQDRVVEVSFVMLDRTITFYSEQLSLKQL